MSNESKNPASSCDLELREQIGKMRGWTVEDPSGFGAAIHYHRPGKPTRSDLPLAESCDGTDLCHEMPHWGFDLGAVGELWAEMAADGSLRLAQGSPAFGGTIICTFEKGIHHFSVHVRRNDVADAATRLARCIALLWVEWKTQVDGRT
jgi:hypothetical protein